MDSIDDDFGKLYADVEAQASSAIEAMYVEPEYVYKDNDLTAGEKLPSGTDEHNQMSDKSDSEGQLKIMVNDDDCERYPVTRARSHGGQEEDEDGDGDLNFKGTGLERNWKPGYPIGDGLELKGNVLNREKGTSRTNVGFHSQFKANVQQARPHGSAYRSTMRISGPASFCSISGRENVGSLGQVANLYATASSLLPQYGYNISHPWYRSTQNVDFDSLEEKPWRYAGADMTDFFNFGFNEDSWKQYCNFLENCWRESSMQTMTFLDSSKLNQPQGRAIKGKDSISERETSMDVWSPRFQDSNVVIQIALQDSSLVPCGSVKGETSQSAQEGSKQGNLDAENDGKFHVTGAAEDDLSGVYLEENVGTVASYASRSLQPKTPSDQKSLDIDSDGNDKIFDDDGHCHGKMKVLTSEQTAEAMETIKEGKEVVIRNTCTPDSFPDAKESSLGNESHLSLSTSCFESDFDSQSNESVDGDSIKVQDPLIRQPHDLGNELQDSGASNHKTSRRDGRKRKQDDDKPYSRHGCPSQDTQKHQRGECHGYGKKKIHLENEYNALPMSDAKGEKKTYPGNRSSDQKDNRHHGGRCCSMTKTDTKNCKNTSPISGVFDKDCSSFDCGRQKGRQHNFGYHREDSSCYRKRGPFCYNGERFAYNHPRAVHTKYPRLRAHHRSREQLDRYIQKNWNAIECFNERKVGIYIEDGMDRNPHRESRGLVSGYSSTLKGRDNRCRRGDDRVQLRKRNGHHCCLFDHKDENEQLPNMYEQSFSFMDHESDLLVETYGKCLPVIEREMEVSGRRFQHCDTAFHPNNSRPPETEDAYHRDAGSKHFLKIHRGRWHDTLSPRNKLYGSRLSKQYLRRWKQIYHEEFGESDWYGSYNDFGDTEDGIISDYKIRPSGRSYSWRSKGLHWTEDELILRHQDYQFPAENALFFHEETSKQDIIHAAPGSFNDKMLVDGLQIGHPRYKLIRERNNVSCLNRNSNSAYRGQDEQRVQKCSGSVNLIVGEGKFSRISMGGRSFARNFGLEKLGMKFLKEKTTSKHHENSQGGKLVKTDIPNGEGDRNDDKLLQKVLVEEHSEDLDIEEGQIIEQEGNNRDNVEKDLVSDIAAQICNVKKSRIGIGNASSGNKDVSEYDNQRILAALAKMMKRRERFKDPDTKKEKPENTSKVEVELVDDTSDTKLQRPARKRRWGAS